MSHKARWRRRRLAFIWLATLSVTSIPDLVAAANAGNAWSRVKEPSAGPPSSIGSTGNGCIAGAIALPPDGPGYVLARLSRRRYYGHPELVDFIQALGRRGESEGLPPVLVGDMAQPRGGPLPFGHASHQTGLDVDIGFTFAAKPSPGTAEREAPDLPSMLMSGGGSVDRAHFGPRQVALLRSALSDPRVDRVFVNPTIKLALCHGAAAANSGESGWLRRLRPWWGHDDHFHVRLRCPGNSAACEPQPAVPEGDGCDAALEDWTSHQTPPKPKAAAEPRAPPSACIALLKETG